MNTDLELATCVASFNDQTAFSELVTRHQAAIRRFLGRLLAGDHGSADDLAQDTFLIAYRKIHSWRGKGSFLAWLHTIAYRQFLQFKRKHARQTVMAEPPETSFDPTSSLQADMLTQHLMRLVSTEERACLTLAYAAGMSHAEITRITTLPLGTVKSHIQRGRRKMQQWLTDNDHSIQTAPETPALEA
jgi:RNA polymerase sigma-70 factor (ECF subfamily)